MNDINNNAPEITTIEAARLLLEKMGVELADLLATPAERLEVPVFEDYIPEGFRSSQRRDSPCIRPVLEPRSPGMGTPAHYRTHPLRNQPARRTSKGNGREAQQRPRRAGGRRAPDCRAPLLV